MNFPIYLDYAATTPCDPAALQVMSKYFTEIFGNPNSLHVYGQEAANALSAAREDLCKILNAENDEVIFTSGSTESNNIVIKRICEQYKDKGVVTLKTEHKSVIEACKLVNKHIFLDVNPDGLLDASLLLNTLNDNEDICLVTICYVNNETGVLQNIKEISQICHNKNVLLHIDATQGFCKLPIDVKDLNIDFLSASGHKIYGPKGIGILYFNKKHLRILREKNANRDVEFGIRAGTVAVPLCMGLAAAAKLLSQNIEKNLEHVRNLRKMLIDGIRKECDEIHINGSEESNYPGIVNIGFRGCEGEALMMEANRICVSSGSACTSNTLSISHVLDAMGIITDIAQSSLRISIGKDTSESDINIAIEDLVNATKKLRDISPLWEMIKNGLDIDGVFNSKRR